MTAALGDAEKELTIEAADVNLAYVGGWSWPCPRSASKKSRSRRSASRGTGNTFALTIGRPSASMA